MGWLGLVLCLPPKPFACRVTPGRPPAKRLTLLRATCVPGRVLGTQGSSVIRTKVLPCLEFMFEWSWWGFGDRK